MTRPAGASRDVLVIRTLGLDWGIAGDDIEEIVPHRTAVRAPGSAPFVEGIVRYRDGILPVVDLSRRFRLPAGVAPPPPPRPEARRTLVVRISGGLAGLTVDEVLGTLPLGADGLAPLPRPVTSPIVRGCLVGDGEDLLVVLDARRILETDEPLDLPLPLGAHPEEEVPVRPEAGAQAHPAREPADVTPGSSPARETPSAPPGWRPARAEPGAPAGPAAAPPGQPLHEPARPAAAAPPSPPPAPPRAAPEPPRTAPEPSRTTPEPPRMAPEPPRTTPEPSRAVPEPTPPERIRAASPSALPGAPSSSPAREPTDARTGPSPAREVADARPSPSPPRAPAGAPPGPSPVREAADARPTPSPSREPADDTRRGAWPLRPAPEAPPPTSGREPAGAPPGPPPRRPEQPPAARPAPPTVSRPAAGPAEDGGVERGAPPRAYPPPPPTAPGAPPDWPADLESSGRARPGRWIAAAVALLVVLGTGLVLATRSTRVEPVPVAVRSPETAPPPARESAPAGSLPPPARPLPVAPQRSDRLVLTLEERLAEGASPEAAETIEEVVDYTVVPGDTLWDIARRFTRNPFRYREIASDNDLRNPHLIFPGQRLTLRIRRLVPAPSPSP